MNHKMSRKLPVGMHVQLYLETGCVCHFFWWGHLTLKSCTCSTGATGMGSSSAGLAAGLAATWAAGLAALLVEGLARGLAALGAGLAGGLAGGSSPCGKQFASVISHVQNLPLPRPMSKNQQFFAAEPGDGSCALFSNQKVLRKQGSVLAHGHEQPCTAGENPVAPGDVRTFLSHSETHGQMNTEGPNLS